VPLRESRAPLFFFPARRTPQAVTENHLMQQLNCRLNVAVAFFAVTLVGAAASADDAARKPEGAWAMMDYGPFLSATIGAGKPSGNVANKGVAIRLGEKGDAGVLFDTDLVRMAAGWTGGFLKLQGVAFDGAHGPNPEAAGDVKFATGQTPGWARPGTKDFADPRSEPFGPLPGQWAKYRGLYLHGEQVVLSLYGRTGSGPGAAGSRAVG
jgi:hypothetical protein